MRTTVTVDDALVARAGELAGLPAGPGLMRRGLEALIREESARHLALLDGSDPKARRRPE